MGPKANVAIGLAEHHGLVFQLPSARSCIALGLCLLGGGLVHAEGPNDRYWVQLEYFRPDVSSTARLDSTTLQVGTSLSLERDLGLAEHQGVPYVLLGARLFDRGRVEFEYYELKRSGTRAAASDIRWGDLTFPASASVDTHFDTAIYRLTAGWSFIHSDRADVGAALGLHVTDFDIGLAGQASLAGQTATFQTQQRNQTVPLPTIGAYATYEFVPRWFVRGRVDWLSLNYKEYDGSLVNVMAAVDWRFAKNVSAGAGYRYVRYTLGLTRPNFEGQIDYRFRGPMVYVSAGF